MKNDTIGSRSGEAGFGFWQALLIIVFLGLVAAAVMKLMSVWIALGSFILAIVLLGILANVSDIRRYLRISSM